MRVGELMQRKVRTLEQYQSIHEAAGVLKFWRFRHLPVVDAADRLVGMVTPADLLQAAREGSDLRDEPVARVMRNPVLSAQEGDDAAATLRRMQEARVHAMPVLGPGDRVEGIVTEEDLLCASGEGVPRLDRFTVEDVMTADPVTVEPTASLGDAARLLLQGDFRHLPVVDGEGRLVGMLSERDLRSHLGEELADYPRATLEALSEPVGDAMTPDPLYLDRRARLDEVFDTFVTDRIGAMPVLDGDRLVGIVSWVDLLRWVRDQPAAARPAADAQSHRA